MSYPLCKFVDAPNVGAAVLFDFNLGSWATGDTWLMHDGFSLGAPTLEGDPDAYGVQYGFRTLSFAIVLEATYADAAKVSAQLARVLVAKRSTWLLFQLTPLAAPVWFKTYRTTPEVITFDYVSNVGDTGKSLWGLAVTLAADPFAYGAQVNLPAVTVVNNPFTAGGCYFTTPTILGDAPAPAVVQVSPSAATAGKTFLVSAIAQEAGAPSTGAPTAVSAQGLQANSDAGAWVVDATQPAGGYVPVSFATSTQLVPRVTDVTTHLPVGKYRVLVSVSSITTSPGSFPLALYRSTFAFAGEQVIFDRSVTSATAWSGWADLGVVTVPFGANMGDRVTVASTLAQISVRAARDSAAGALRIGALLYVPLETPWSLSSRSFYARFGTTGLTASQTGEWDGENFASLTKASLPARVVSESWAPLASGGLPELVPGCTNTITVLQQTNVSAPDQPANWNSDDIAATVVVGVSYRPRWLYLAAS